MEFILLIMALIPVAYYGSRLFARSPKSEPESTENAELVKVLLGLEAGPLEDLFTLYKKEFGAGAAHYARETYRKWQAGQVRPNRKTFARFFTYLPKVMNFDLKCEVLRKLREAYCAKDNYELTVYTDDWKQTLAPLVKEVIARASEAELPKSLTDRLRWLADDDVEIAGTLLSHSQTREALNSLSLLEQEFTNIEQLLDNTKGRGKVTHVLRLPLGTITLKIKQR